MGGTALLFLFLGAAGAILAAFLYRRRELPVRGRSGLLALRALSFLLLGVILANPSVPGADPDRADGGRVRVLIHAEPSLELPAEGRRLWDAVVARAVALEGDGALLALSISGEEAVEGIDGETLRRRAPSFPAGELDRGSARLAELGADTVVILSTFRISPEQMRRMREQTPVPVRLERFGGPVRNAGIDEFELPRRALADEEMQATLAIFGEEGRAGEEVTVEIRREDVLIREVTLPLPEPGRLERADVRLPPPGPGEEEGTRIRYTARVTLAGDAFPSDDERVRRVELGAPPGGVVLLSFRPGWEPRLLLPLLAEVTGLEREGAIRVAGGRWLSLEAGDDPVRVVAEGELAERARRANLLVVHGAEARMEGALQRAVEAHPRALLLPGGAGVIPGRAGGGGRAASPALPVRRGEWRVEAELPASPVRALLDGIGLGAVPPLGDLQVRPPAASEVPVLFVRGEDGEDRVPALVLVESAQGRQAIALATGFWRWAVREGEPRTLYRGLWAGVAGWLLERPDAQTQGNPGTGVREAEAMDQPGVGRWVPSLRRPPLPGPPVEVIAGTGHERGSGAGRPLRTHPLPYLVLLALLCAEWIGRRKAGLR